MNFINNEIIKLKGLKDKERCHLFKASWLRAAVWIDDSEYKLALQGRAVD